MAGPAPQITLTAQCLCKAQTITTSVTASDLPLKGTSCHCASCRRLTGALRSSDAVWPSPLSSQARSSLKHYAFSDRVGVLFCGVCSSPMFWEDRPEPGAKAQDTTYRVFTGVLTKETPVGWEEGKELVRWASHMFVGDTKDGGATCWLRGMGQDLDQESTSEGKKKGIKMWLGANGKSEEVTEQWPWPALEKLPPARGEGVQGDVSIKCHCGGVDLVLQAGNAQREFAEMVRRGEQDALPWFVDPVAPHKLLATQDACDSCRIWSGVEVWNWTFSLLKHLTFSGGNKKGGAFPEDTTELRVAVKAKDPTIGTLAFYVSSQDVQRYFCSRCSASVFYAVDDRPEMVDISVGLLSSPDGGARAESILSWSLQDKVGLRQDMLGTWREKLLLGVEEEMEEWGAARGYPKRWARIAKRKAD